MPWRLTSHLTWCSIRTIRLERLRTRGNFLVQGLRCLERYLLGLWRIYRNRVDPHWGQLLRQSEIARSSFWVSERQWAGISRIFSIEEVTVDLHMEETWDHLHQVITSYKELRRISRMGLRQWGNQDKPHDIIPTCFPAHLICRSVLL